MKKRFILIAINLLIAFWESFFFIRNSDFSNKTEWANYFCLTLTVMLPTVVLVLPSFFIKKQSHLDEIYVIPIVVTLIFVAVNTIAMIFLSIFNKTSMELTLIIEGILFTVYAIIMLFVAIAMNHMVKVNKK